LKVVKSIKESPFCTKNYRARKVRLVLSPSRLAVGQVTATAATRDPLLLA